jgi:hypothetical protein
MKSLIMIVLMAIMAVACATTPQSPAQSVYAAEQGYVVALTTAAAYARLPHCSATVTGLCSDVSVVVKLQTADEVASQLLGAAEATVRAGGGTVGTAVTAAQEAVTTFLNITKTLKVK